MQTLESERSGPRRPRWTPWLASAAALFLFALLARARPPQPGEGPGLRWLRMLAEHPVRGALALGLVLWALSPRREPPSDDPGLGADQGL